MSYPLLISDDLYSLLQEGDSLANFQSLKWNLPKGLSDSEILSICLRISSRVVRALSEGSTIMLKDVSGNTRPIDLMTEEPPIVEINDKGRIVFRVQGLEVTQELVYQLNSFLELHNFDSKVVSVDRNDVGVLYPVVPTGSVQLGESKNTTFPLTLLGVKNRVE